MDEREQTLEEYVESMSKEYRQRLLTVLLAKTTTAHKDFSEAETEVLVDIGAGMFWSEELDQAARALAEQARRELDRAAPFICGDRDPS